MHNLLIHDTRFLVLELSSDTNYRYTVQQGSNLHDSFVIFLYLNQCFCVALRILRNFEKILLGCSQHLLHFTFDLSLYQRALKRVCICRVSALERFNCSIYKLNSSVTDSLMRNLRFAILSIRTYDSFYPLCATRVFCINSSGQPY